MTQATMLIVTRIDLLRATRLFTLQDILLLSTLCDLAKKIPTNHWQEVLYGYDPYLFETRFNKKRLNTNQLLGPLSAWLALDEFDFRQENLFRVIYEHTLPQTTHKKAKALFVANHVAKKTFNKTPSSQDEKIALFLMQQKIDRAYDLSLKLNA